MPYTANTSVDLQSRQLYTDEWTEMGKTIANMLSAQYIKNHCSPPYSGPRADFQNRRIYPYSVLPPYPKQTTSADKYESAAKINQI